MLISPGFPLGLRISNRLKRLRASVAIKMRGVINKEPRHRTPTILPLFFFWVFPRHPIKHYKARVVYLGPSYNLRLWIPIERKGEEWDESEILKKLNPPAGRVPKAGVMLTWKQRFAHGNQNKEEKHKRGSKERWDVKREVSSSKRKKKRCPSTNKKDILGGEN